MTGVITASEPSWIAPFAGLSARQFGKLIIALRRDGADPVHRGRSWSLLLEDRGLLVAAYWRTNLTLRQLAPLFGIPSRPPTTSSPTSGQLSRSGHGGAFAGTRC